jgi:hypothetical protein
VTRNDNNNNDDDDDDDDKKRYVLEIEHILRKLLTQLSINFEVTI